MCDRRCFSIGDARGVVMKSVMYSFISACQILFLFLHPLCCDMMKMDGMHAIGTNVKGTYTKTSLIGTIASADSLLCG